MQTNYTEEMAKIGMTIEDADIAYLLVSTVASSELSKSLVKSIFDKFDENKNGILEKNEVKKMIEEFGQTGKMPVPGFFYGDDEQELTEEEKKAKLKSFEEVLYKEFDDDKNQQFSYPEIAHFFRLATITEALKVLKKDIKTHDPVPSLKKGKEFLLKFIQLAKPDEIQAKLNEKITGRKADDKKVIKKAWKEGGKHPGKFSSTDYVNFSAFYDLFLKGEEKTWMDHVLNVKEQLEKIKKLPPLFDQTITLAQDLRKMEFKYEK